jgi:two-component system, NarL family, sensor kinase
MPSDSPGPDRSSAAGGPEPGSTRPVESGGVARRPPLRRSTVALAAVVPAAAAAAGLGQLCDPHALSQGMLVFPAAIAVSFTAMAALVLRGAPGQLVGRLMGAAGVISCVETVAGSWFGWLPLAWLSQWAWWPPFGLIFLALLVFPDGRLPSRRWRPLAVLITAGTVIAAAALAVAAWSAPTTLLTDIVPVPRPAHPFMVVAVIAAAGAVTGLIGAIAALGIRWRRADSELRRQLACLLIAGLLLIAFLALDAVGVPGAGFAAAVVVPLAMTVAVLRFRLYQLDAIINRTLVWLVLTILAIAGFVAIVALLKGILTNQQAPAVATGLVAVSLEPLHRQVQRRVNRLLYGERDDPYKVITDLGHLLGRTVDPDAVLPLLVGTIAESLRVPYVAVEESGPDGVRLLAEHGTPTSAVVRFDMLAHGERVGRLVVATRSPTRQFTPREHRLLESVALHAAVAAQSTRLFRDLRDSRERLVMTREEERRRLRRDLHDGLGPSLVGLSMQVEAVRKLVAGPARATAILDGLAGDLSACRAEIRLVVDHLRPAALDSGLAAALRAECQRFSTPALTVGVQFVGDLDGLPAAVEVAAFRVVAEALTNVTRHALAGSCRVLVQRDRWLRIEVADDGIGIGAPTGDGVGLSSMRERAAELGGQFAVTRTEPGTAVTLRIPVPLARRATPAAPA